MFTGLLSLLGGGLGALIRFVPEVLKFFNERNERDHEFRMLQEQRKLDESRSQQRIDELYAQGDMSEQAAYGTALIEAIKGQAKPTGIRWVDALSASVRPVITYWWMALYTLIKAAVVAGASIEFYLGMKAAAFALGAVSGYLEVFVTRTWTAWDAGILGMILGFWFVDRTIRKYRQH